MLPSLSWGTWDQLNWKDKEGSNVDGTNCRSRASDKRANLQQMRSANSSEWKRRYGGAKCGAESPLFERLISRLAKEIPAAVPIYESSPMKPAGSGPGRFAVDWQSLGPGVAPTAGGLDHLRSSRKAQQVDNLLSAAIVFVEHRLAVAGHARVVEFCGGSGHVALPVAALFRDKNVEVVVLDMKEKSLDLARKRVAEAGLSNIEISCERLEVNRVCAPQH
mmetsp:Transcript_44948/g.101464  ORF Transcript_44948/g.101464 Transcript_44948/m.101464 type:complete len:220 (-) Transcript_44948:1190-1849(-)|eukprot:CAMPEP_0172615980 /NCGR_PEP_ID=MMETSP1068-20121228/62632_1 /TAXON_ID=35684 /ORGANISM="Pseudopedinella elastica, Strain CCMP716" /LENGTH=219 /DNA_ID=CAMNT_0013421281 /DNA_START=67 /DNA_END=726 /DNA_ORIENTATION=-